MSASGDVSFFSRFLVKFAEILTFLSGLVRLKGCALT